MTATVVDLFAGIGVGLALRGLWSRAGKGLGMEGPTGRLVFEPLRWVHALRPRWVAMEQVPGAGPAFRAMAHDLEAHGYRCQVARLSAEEYGVPQTRERVYLIAHRDRTPRLPTATHQPYKPGVAPERPCNLMGLLPWVSMAEALGWADGVVLDRRQTDVPTIDTWLAPCPTITGTAVGKGVWTLKSERRPVDERRPRTIDEPAPTLIGHIGHAQSPGDDRGMFYGPDGRTLKLTLAQGCTLMGFPDPTRVAAALPASKRAAWQIIGNACCPPVVAAIVEELAS